MKLAAVPKPKTRTRTPKTEALHAEKQDARSRAASASSSALRASGVGERVPAGAITAEKKQRLTQAERTALSDARLMKAAVKLIAEHGYQATSLESIGKLAGYSRGLVSHRFGSKEGLLRVLVRTMIARWSERMRDPALAGRSGAEAVRSAVQAHGLSLRETPDSVRALYKLMFESHGELEPLRPEFARIDREQRELIVSLIRAGQQQGAITKDVDPATYAILLLASLRGIVMQWLIEPAAVDVERVYGALDEQIASHLAPAARKTR